MKITISVCKNGVKDTDLSTLNATQDSLVKLFTEPTVGPKDGAYFIRTTGSKRTNTDTTDTASILILDGDSRIDRDTGEVVDGAPPPVLVHEALKANRINHVLYTSHSHGKHGADYHKYRAVIPVKYSREQLPVLLDAVHEPLHNSEVMLFNVAENRSWAQAWYFPRCPQERLHLFESFAYLDGNELNADQICNDYLARHPAPAEPTAKKSDPARSKSAQNRIDPIQLFNDYWKSPVNYLLTQGYKPKGNRLLHPLSQSMVAGVHICRNCKDGVERVFSHGSDPLNDGYPHDAFDCFTILEHGSDFTAALLEIARNWTVNGMTIEAFNRKAYKRAQS